MILSSKLPLPIFTQQYLQLKAGFCITCNGKSINVYSLTFFPFGLEIQEKKLIGNRIEIGQANHALCSERKIMHFAQSDTIISSEENVIRNSQTNPFSSIKYMKISLLNFEKVQIWERTCCSDTRNLWSWHSRDSPAGKVQGIPDLSSSIQASAFSWGWVGLKLVMFICLIWYI